MKEMSKTFLKTVYLAVMTAAFAAVFCMSVYALPADDELVFATKTGKVWHEFRNCEDLVGYDAWGMTFAEYKKEKKNSTECSKCKNGQELTDDVIGKTYVYEGGFTRKTEMTTELFVGNSKDAKGSGSGGDTVSDTQTENTDTGSANDTQETASNSTQNSKTSKSNTSKTSNSTSKNSTSKSTSKTTASSGSAASSSGSSSSAKDLMTERQRHKKFFSLSNPKRGTVVPTASRPKSAGFSYADFGKYNDYNSNNGLGGDFIYLLGTIMQMEPVKEKGNQYGVAMMVNDCDGYQWYMRYYCAKDKYALLKSELTGKQAYIYGNFSGYSGVTDRPMMDVLTVIEVGGKALDLRLFK